MHHSGPHRSVQTGNHKAQLVRSIEIPHVVCSATFRLHRPLPARKVISLDDAASQTTSSRAACGIAWPAGEA